MAAAAGVASTVAMVGKDKEPFVPHKVSRQREQPNILVILGDDMGWGDLSCYGSPGIRTPHLDRLAESGLQFTDGYSASSVCSPTRIALYTGRHPGRLKGGLQEPIGPPSRLDGIPTDHPTLASLLRDVGYETAMYGKWHCGYLPWFSPTRVGWDEFFGNFSGGLDYFSKVNFLGEYDLYEDEVEYKDLRYYTHILTERAVDFLHRRHDKPWLLNLNYTTPHWPWETPADQEVSKALMQRVDAGEPGVLPDYSGGSLATYAAMVEDLDAAVGEVLHALRRTDQHRQTVVFFASDNGGERFSYVWPFVGGKFGLNEGGIRVPTLLSWPGTLPGGKVSRHPIITMDVTATLLEIAGAAAAPDYPLDGASLAGFLFEGEDPVDHDLFWRMSNARALRRGSLKYFQDPDGKDHLFDLAADDHEQADLAGVRLDDLLELRSAWESIDATLLSYS